MQRSRAELLAGRIGLVCGPLFATACYLGLPDSYAGSGGEAVALSAAGRATLAMMVWMATWWLTQALPIPATALLPVALFPLFGILPGDRVAAAYGSDIIFLFMGGFVLGLAIQRWGLDRRIALLTLRMVGTRPSRIVGGFMLTTAFLSMWVSNTATAAMMLPIGLSIIAMRDECAGDAGSTRAGNFAVALMLGIAYAASIGGLATIIGSPPNGIAVRYIESNLGQQISFARWMSIGGPLVAVFLPLTWLLLCRVLHPVGDEPISRGGEWVDGELRKLGPIGRGEGLVLAIFLLAVAAWVFRPLLVDLEFGGVAPFARLSDAGVAMIAALLLFCTPVRLQRAEFVMDWASAEKLPWGILILFGGGLALAAAVQANGVAQFIGAQALWLDGVPPLVLLAGLTALIIFLTELTSNTATTATMVPVFAAAAPALGLDPLLPVLACALAASCAFMMPVATPPNAIVFGSNRVTLVQMARAGLLLNLIGVVLITALCQWWVGRP
jgi:sodium-dependent dicarboxylate transporter 2/3/5